ncbi:MAG: hypothetical protein ABEK04_06095 [Candidatus Nanohalobium sp.]
MPSIKETVSHSYDGEDDEIEYSHSDGVKVNRSGEGLSLDIDKYDAAKGSAAGLTGAALLGGGYGAVETAADAGSDLVEGFREYLLEASANPQNVQHATEAGQWAQEVITSLS